MTCILSPSIVIYPISSNNNNAGMISKHNFPVWCKRSFSKEVIEVTPRPILCQTKNNPLESAISLNFSIFSFNIVPDYCFNIFISIIIEIVK